MVQTRWLATGAEAFLAALLAVGLFTAGSLLPVLGVICSFFSLLPLVVLRLRQGRLALALALAGAILGLAGPISSWQALAFLLEFGLPAVLLGEGLRRAIRPEWLVTGVAALASIGGLSVLVATSGQWASPLGAVRGHVEALLTQMEVFTAQMGLAGEGTGGASGSAPGLRAFLLAAFPGLFFAGSLLTASGYLLLLRALIRRWPAHLGGVALEPFRWELPEPLVWAFIGTGLAYLSGLPWLQPIGLNGLLILTGLYFLQGLSIAAFLFQRFRLPRFLAALSVLLLVFQPFLTLLVAGLGLFDVWFAFRRLSLPRTPRQT